MFYQRCYFNSIAYILFGSIYFFVCLWYWFWLLILTKLKTFYTMNNTNLMLSRLLPKNVVFAKVSYKVSATGYSLMTYTCSTKYRVSSHIHTRTEPFCYRYWYYWIVKVRRWKNLINISSWPIYWYNTYWQQLFS